MSDAVAIVLFFGGAAVFVASLFYARAVLRFQKETKDIFRWNPDPRIQTAEQDESLNPVVVVEGPRGKAEIFEILDEAHSTQYRVRFGDKSETRQSMEDAYVSAGQLVGSVRR